MRKKANLVILSLLVLFNVPCALAQLRPPRDHHGATLAADAPTQPEQAADAASFGLSSGPTADELRRRNRALIAGTTALVAAYGLRQWWDDGFNGDFRTENEGWFGSNTDSGGADKLGHAYFSYTGTRLLSRGFEALGNPPEAASRLAFWSTLAVMTAVEVADGFSRQYRFSPQDALMNVVGVGFGLLMERNPALDRLLDFRLLYRPSADSNFDPGGDYSGQTYLLVLKASGVNALRTHDVARYFELALGYGTRGFENPPGSDRSRNLYVGISLNISEILRQTVFRGDRERGLAQRSSELFFEFIQVPGTAALHRHRL